MLDITNCAQCQQEVLATEQTCPYCGQSTKWRVAIDEMRAQSKKQIETNQLFDRWRSFAANGQVTKPLMDGIATRLASLIVENSRLANRVRQLEGAARPRAATQEQPRRRLP